MGEGGTYRRALVALHARWPFLAAGPVRSRRTSWAATSSVADATRIPALADHTGVTARAGLAGRALRPFGAFLALLAGRTGQPAVAGLTQVTARALITGIALQTHDTDAAAHTDRTGAALVAFLAARALNTGRPSGTRRTRRASPT